MYLYYRKQRVPLFELNFQLRARLAVILTIFISVNRRLLRNYEIKPEAGQRSHSRSSLNHRFWKIGIFGHVGLATSDIGFSWWAAKWYAPKRYALYGDTQRDTQLLFASLRPSPAPTTLELKI